MKWYRLAAKQGNAMAQNNLGLKYTKGQGVPQDFGTAHMWLNPAAAEGFNGAAEARGNLGQQICTADLSEAQRRARVCLASNHQDCD